MHGQVQQQQPQQQGRSHGGGGGGNCGSGDCNCGGEGCPILCAAVVVCAPVVATGGVLWDSIERIKTNPSDKAAWLKLITEMAAIGLTTELYQRVMADLWPYVVHDSGADSSDAGEDTSWVYYFPAIIMAAGTTWLAEKLITKMIEKIQARCCPTVDGISKTPLINGNPYNLGDGGDLERGQVGPGQTGGLPPYVPVVPGGFK